jgi:hypothetical protein
MRLSPVLAFTVLALVVAACGASPSGPVDGGGGGVDSGLDRPPTGSGGSIGSGGSMGGAGAGGTAGTGGAGGGGSMDASSDTGARDGASDQMSPEQRADGPADDDAGGDCRIRSCPGDYVCMPCRGKGGGVFWDCLPGGGAC